MNRRLALVVGLGLVLGVATGVAAAERYQVYLSPMPFNDATQPMMQGKGTATATLDGETLSISGSFAGLSGPATKAHLSLSRGPGIPGASIVDLTLAGDIVLFEQPAPQMARGCFFAIDLDVESAAPQRHQLARIEFYLARHLAGHIAHESQIDQGTAGNSRALAD